MATTEHYGTAAGAFLRSLVKACAADRQAVIGTIRATMSGFLANYLPAQSDGQVSRVAARFALVAAAGELAASYRVVSWPAFSAFNGVGACFDAWINTRRGGIGPAEIAAALEDVRLFVQQHGAARFEDIDQDADKKIPVRDRAGFRHKTDYSNGQVEYCIFPGIWRAEVCKGHNPTDVARWAAEAGLLVRDDEHHLQAQRRFEGRKDRFYVVRLPGADADEAQS